MNVADFLHANTYSGKLKVTLIVIGGYVQIYMWLLKPQGFFNLLYLNEWNELIFWMFVSVRKAKSYYGYAHGQIWLWPFRSWDSKICFISRINWWTTACCHYSANEMQDKNKNKLMRESFSCFIDYKNNITFFCKKHLNKQNQADIWFKEQQFLVLKEVKRTINIKGSLAE